MPKRARRILIAAFGALCVIVAGAGCGSGSPVAQQALAGAPATPPRPTPPLVLNDSVGRSVDLRQFRGKAVVVTFLYTHCHDICPLIAADLHDAVARLGADAGKLQIVAVSTDPRGDNRRSVADFLRKHLLTGRMEYLIGSRRQLAKVWAAWQVTVAPGSAGRVAHTGILYGISASGKITTIYPSSFQPAQIVHDVPLLASR